MITDWVGTNVSGSVLERMSLKGRTALVTGGSRGIGEAIARGLAEAGASVVIASRTSIEKGDEVAASLRELGVDSYACLADVADRAAMGQAVDDMVARWGRIDILVANAGIGIDVNAEDMTEEQWDRLMDVNLKGVFFAAQAAAKHMIPAKRGNILVTSSLSQHVVNGNPQACYNASKAGVGMLVKCLAYEWAQHNIRVNAISPGFIYTNILDRYLQAHADEAYGYMARPAAMNRIGSPDELAGTAVLLASDASSFTTGQSYIVDGGYSLTPLENRLLPE